MKAFVEMFSGSGTSYLYASLLVFEMQQQVIGGPIWCRV